jgi:hypothetical protein
MIVYTDAAREKSAAMGKSNQTDWEKKISNAREEGRGQGVGIHYKPWFRTKDVPSQGLSSRDRGIITNRVHHLLSGLELNYFHCLEWSPIVVDIREQYPLFEREDTQRIAEACGFRHPRYPGNKVDSVMTTDFLVSVQLPSGATHDYARTIKPARDLQDRRTLEKFDIERRYWLDREVDWKIVTERDIPQAFAKNAGAFRAYRDIDDRVTITAQRIAEIAHWLTEQVRNSEAPLLDILSSADKHFSLQEGASLDIVFHLLATRRWHINMYELFEPKNPLVLLVANLESLSLSSES